MMRESSVQKIQFYLLIITQKCTFSGLLSLATYLYCALPITKATLFIKTSPFSVLKHYSYNNTNSSSIITFFTNAKVHIIFSTIRNKLPFLSYFSTTFTLNPSDSIFISYYQKKGYLSIRKILKKTLFFNKNY